jgi:hypothetical protein
MKEETQGLPFSILHGELIEITGVIFLLVAAISILLPFFIPFISVIFIVVSIFIPLFVGIQTLYVGLIGKKFQSIQQSLSVRNIHFDMLRLTMSLFMNNRMYYILYHVPVSPYAIWAILTHNLSRGEIPPEHYQIWTEISWPEPVNENPYQLGRYLRSSGSREILLGELVQPIPPDDPFSDDLEDYYSEPPKILSLCYVGVALQGRSPVLIAFLRGNAPTDDIVHSIYELETIKNNIEHTD